MEAKMLKGNKVLLRSVKRSDIKYFLKWYNDPEILQYLAMYLPMTEISEEKWIEAVSIKKDMVFFVIEAIKNNSRKKTIGTCGLSNINAKDHYAEFGIAIGEKKFWNNGYGTEAAQLLIDYGFMQLNLHRIHSGVYEFNAGSLKMHEKLRFTEEGHSRKEVYKNGKYWDKINFGLLKEEWEKNQQEILKSQ